MPRTSEVNQAGASAASKPSLTHPALALASLLGATFLGTTINNILNVPLRQITRDFHVDVSAGVLVVSSFVIVLAGGITLSGWVGDRVGRRRILIASLVLMVAAMVGAALAPSLPFLVAMRAVQGLACAAYPPAVMSLLATLYGPARRARLLSAWAAANGLGQAVGPPFGGLLADAFGWRSIFWILVPIGFVVLAGVLRSIPPSVGHASPLHWQGAVSLTAGAALLMTAATAAPQHVVPGWVSATIAAFGVVLLVVFVRTSVGAAHPLIRPSLITETRFLRSAVAASTQMFCLSATLVAVPLYLTGSLGRSTSDTGLLVLALPITMALLAPFVGLVGERVGPRRVLRVGLLLLAGADFVLGCYLHATGSATLAIVALLVLVGAGVALVQTPSATGATRSPAGRSGAGLGLFNTLRFGGSALGAAWVALVYPRDALLVLFAGCAVVALIGLAVSFAGTDPPAASDVAPPDVEIAPA